ncbi:hypothetical protein JCM19992_12280 [Thermostilla marina]
MKLLRAIYRWFERPPRFIYTADLLGKPGAEVLDIGCGNHSPTLTKRHFPACRYSGADCLRWNLDEEDDRATDAFYRIDLDEPEQMEHLPAEAFDVVFCSHVLEHTEQPYEIIARLPRLLKPGGKLFIEVPSRRSLHLPRARNGWCGIRGCLNFFDDPTHKTMIDLRLAAASLSAAGLQIERRGRRFLWRRVLLLPAYVLAGIVLRGYVPASVVWDITGFAEILVARRPAEEAPASEESASTARAA